MNQFILLNYKIINIHKNKPYVCFMKLKLMKHGKILIFRYNKLKQMIINGFIKIKLQI